jgi:hypothetical protein
LHVYIGRCDSAVYSGGDKEEEEVDTNLVLTAIYIKKGDRVLEERI